MITLENGLYLRVEQLPHGPMPLPLASGFNTATAYRALGLYNPSETSDAYFVFANDRDEIWFICNRHLRALGVLPGSTAMRLPLAQVQARVQALQVQDQAQVPQAQAGSSAPAPSAPPAAAGGAA